MNGILCIDKPAGFTSFDVVAKLRGMAKTRKIGHGGTLDPMATGVLPLFLGSATKAVDLLPNQDKRYTARFQLGTVTDTLDITGKVLEERPVTARKGDVEAALASFSGEMMQLPPMYSAVQVNGVRLYDLARQGVEVERKPRAVTFYHIELLSWDEAAGTYDMDVHCSKGTYIRSLCHDIGEKLGCGAVLTQLCRTQAGAFTLSQCLSLEAVQTLTDQGILEEALLPVASAFGELPRLILTPEQTRLLQNGVRLSLDKLLIENNIQSHVAIYTEKGIFIGLAKADWPAGELRVVKLFERGDVE